MIQVLLFHRVFPMKLVIREKVATSKLMANFILDNINLSLLRSYQIYEIRWFRQINSIKSFNIIHCTDCSQGPNTDIDGNRCDKNRNSPLHIIQTKAKTTKTARAALKRKSQVLSTVGALFLLLLCLLWMFAVGKQWNYS